MIRRKSIAVIGFLLLSSIFWLSACAATRAKASNGDWENGILQETRFEAGDGSEAAPYLITSAGQLAFLAQRVEAGDLLYLDKHYRVVRDIDLRARGWVPIGRDDTVRLPALPGAAKPFRGTFDGGFRRISGLRYKSSGRVLVGFFGLLEGAVVRNVVLEDVLIDGTGCMTVGGLAGKLIGGRIENCVVEGRVWSDRCIEGRGTAEMRSIGGIVGRNFEGTVVGCVNNASVFAADAPARFFHVGGIVGANNRGFVKFCINNASVTGAVARYSHTGGVAGLNDEGEIERCSNGGPVVGGAAVYQFSHSNTGGIAGENDGSISECVNSAPVKGEWADEYSNAGGIAGWNLKQIVRSANIGRVDGWKRGEQPPKYALTGGVAGRNSGDAALLDCSNRGSVTGRKFGTAIETGGIVGRDSGKRADCINLGAVLEGVPPFRRADSDGALFSGVVGTAWFYSYFDPYRPRLKCFYESEDASKPAVAALPESATFDFGTPASRQVFLSGWDGRIEIENVVPSKGVGLERSTFRPSDPSKIVLEYDGEGKLNGHVEIFYKFRHDRESFERFSTKLPVTLRRMPQGNLGKPDSLTWTLAAGTLLFGLLTLSAGPRTAGKRSKNSNEDVYP